MNSSFISPGLNCPLALSGFDGEFSWCAQESLHSLWIVLLQHLSAGLTHSPSILVVEVIVLEFFVRKSRTCPIALVVEVIVPEFFVH